MVQVQQQVGSHDCGLFACASVELLSYHQDPSQFSFNQASVRPTFANFWGFKAGEKSASQAATAYGKSMAAQNQNDVLCIIFPYNI